MKTKKMLSETGLFSDEAIKELDIQILNLIYENYKQSKTLKNKNEDI